MLQEAKQEADRVLAEAREEAARLAGETEVVKRAERDAQDIVREAEARSREIRLGAEDYADQVLARWKPIWTSSCPQCSAAVNGCRGPTRASRPERRLRPVGGAARAART